jgi:hypothetical protein
MQFTLRSLTLYILAIVGFVSCSEESNPKLDEEIFTKIYDNKKFYATYSPIAIVQTPDEGFLMLGEKTHEDTTIYHDIYLIKVDKSGNFVKEQEVDKASVNPIAELMEFQAKYYFFCMDEASKEAQIAEVDANLEAITVNTVNGVGYPLAARLVDNNFLLLSYSNVDKVSRVSFVNNTGNVSASKNFSIGAGDDVEEPIIDHITHTGQHFPFDVGKFSNGLYYFNGFYNYTFSLVLFSSFDEDSAPVSVIQGNQDDGGFSGVSQLAGGKFALARFNFGDNYFIPNASLSLSGFSSASDINGYSLPELVANTKVRIMNVSINNKNVLIYAADTKSKQIGLYAYDDQGAFLGSDYLGFSNPFELGNFIQTSDGGLAVAGTTYIAGRFQRICLFKLSKDQLNKLIQ